MLFKEIKLKRLVILNMQFGFKKQSAWRAGCLQQLRFLMWLPANSYLQTIAPLSDDGLQLVWEGKGSHLIPLNHVKLTNCVFELLLIPVLLALFCLHDLIDAHEWFLFI